MILVWIGVSVLGAVAFGVLALARGETVSAAWLLTAAVCTYVIYRIYLRPIEAERRHVKQLSELHLATLEALATAIDAKDQTAENRVHQLQVFAAGLAEALGLSTDEIQGVIYEATDLGIIVNVPLPRPRPGYAPMATASVGN